MTISNHVRAGIMGLALMGCKDKRTKPEQYDTHCIAVYADSSMKLCTDRSPDGKLIAVYDPVVHSVCFSEPGQETRCGSAGFPLTPQLKEATERAFMGIRDLSYLVDKAVRENRK